MSELTPLSLIGCDLSDLLNLSYPVSLLGNIDNKTQITLFQKFVVGIK